MRRLFTYIFLLISLFGNAATYYISPTGDDSRTAVQAQNIATPWRTLAKGWTVLVAGDILYCRGGTYPSSASTFLYNKVGTAANRINIWNYPGEKPVFDFTGTILSENRRAIALFNTNYTYIRGLRFTGMVQTAGWFHVGIQLEDNCSNNILENCEADHIGGNGISIKNLCNNNLFLNCDTYSNQDPFSSPPYENTNGFNLTGSGSNTSTNNIFRYCRSWWNADDGFDTYGTVGTVIFEGCWSFWNGYIPGTFTHAGNGIGFKLGRGGLSSTTANLRTLTNCLAFENYAGGFDDNLNGPNDLFQSTLYNNTAYGNGRLPNGTIINSNAVGFQMVVQVEINTLKNNLAYKNGNGSNGAQAAINTQSVQSNNSWQLFHSGNVTTVADADFVSISSAGMDGPRQANGALPILGFMHLISGKQEVNAGVNVGLPFCGSAPDVGAFEFCAGNTSPQSFAGVDQTITLPTSTATMTGSGTDADGTIASYLWTQIGGTAATITTASNPLTTITGLTTAGSRTFRLTVTDNLGATATDDMIILVNAAANQPPVAGAGTDKNITLPTNSVTQVGSASDPDGTVAGILWTRVSGPATFNIVSPTQATTVINNLVQGTYVFNIRVTDNVGATANDQVTIVVNPAVNQPPIANAGGNKNITLPTNSVTQVGSGTDVDGTIASYLWTKTSGPATFNIVSSTSATTVINNLVAGTYTFQLQVTDNQGATAVNTATVVVNPAPNQPPISNAGPNQVITLPTASVTMAGSGTDPDGSIASYLWTKTAGPATFNIVTPSSATTVINNLVAGTYTFNLLVTDNLGLTANDQMTVLVNAAPPPNQPPISNAGTDKNITLPTNSITQVGSGTDADGTVTGYAWTKTAGPATFTIVSPSAATTVINNLVQGTYVFQLMVTDNLGLTATDQMSVIVNAAPIIPPIANAGTDKNITLPTSSVSQVGSGTDADGTVVAYLWSKTSGPATFTIETPTTSTTLLSNLVQGTYTFQLQVTDNVGATGTDQMSVIVNAAPNAPPLAGAGPDQVITLPTATATMAGTASDPGGSVASTLWTQIGGTASTITNSASLTTTITGLTTAGSRTYKLLVTDNLGSTTSDTMIILVNPAANIPPTANAGADKVITLPVTTTSFAGSGSDPDGSIVAYLWTQVSGTAATIVSATQANTNITNLTTAGVRVFQLRVTDNSGATATDQVTVTVNAALIPPTANAGANQSITLPTSSVTLTGSGTDPDGTITTYAWTKISGPAGGTITSASSAITTVTGYTNAGNYVYQLVVTDNSGLTGSSTTQVTVIAANIPPTANAGANQTITLPTSSVTLTGSGNDPDGTISAYAWVKISGPVGGLIATPSSAVTSVTGYTNAGTYVYRLTVTDNGGLTGSSTTQIIVNSAPPPNQPPVVNAGTDKVLTLPTNSVSQVGSATDPDGTVVSYLWTKISGPAAFTINTPTAATTTLSNLVQGTYIFQLAATDNQSAVGTDQATVTVNSAPNIPPVANAGTDKNITLPTNSISQVGSGTDADGVVTTYQWTKISGPATFTIVTPAASTTTINNLVAGTYIFQLQVTDNNSASGTDQMTVIVNPVPNTPPLAGAGPDQVITLPTATATMAGTASDPGGSVATILWTQIGGTASTITNSASLTTTITGLSTAGSRTYKLLVTDNLGLTASDTMIILVNPAPNVPPVVNAGINQSITLPTGTVIGSVTLTGIVTDADGTIANVLWTKVSGPTSYNIVSQSQPITVVNNLVYGVYNFNLRATDNTGATTNDQIQVTVDTTYITPPPFWTPPTANAGVDYNPIICVFCSSTSVTVTGSGHSDSGTIVIYQWARVSGPASFTINSPNTASTIIRNLVRGTYVFTLTVFDNLGYSAVDTMTINVRKNHLIFKNGKIVVQAW